MEHLIFGLLIVIIGLVVYLLYDKQDTKWLLHKQFKTFSDILSDVMASSKEIRRIQNVINDDIHSLFNKMKPVTIDARFDFKQHLRDDMDHLFWKDELGFNIDTYYQQHNDSTDRNACWDALAYLRTSQRGFIRVRPEPEGNGIPHKITMLIQNGPIGSTGVHGIQVTDMIEYCGHILDILNRKFPCNENRESLRLISLVLEQQSLRTKRRTEQGTEGKNEEIDNV